MAMGKDRETNKLDTDPCLPLGKDRDTDKQNIFFLALRNDIETDKQHRILIWL